MHRLGAPSHGWMPEASAGIWRIGPLALAAEPGDEWPRFYAEQRLLPLLRLARERAAIDRADAAAVERICDRIDEFAGPPEPPARLHGDLWGGNVLADAAGEGWLIDCAAHGGNRELDLAMLRLFGAPSERIFDAYEEVHPPAAGAAERVSLHQLLPLLVHAVLFGGSYGAAAGRAARRYA